MGDTKLAKKEQAVVRVVTHILFPATCDTCKAANQIYVRPTNLGISFPVEVNPYTSTKATRIVDRDLTVRLQTLKVHTMRCLRFVFGSELFLCKSFEWCHVST